MKKSVVLTDPKKYFWFQSGKSMRSISELANSLPSISNEEFSYHVNTRTHKNDFADWIEHVFGEKELAIKLRSCRNRIEFQSILYNYMIRDDLKQRKKKKTERQERVETEVTSNSEAFVTYHQMSAKKDDALADRFDAVAQRFQDETHPEIPEDVARRIGVLEERYKDLKRKISDTRRSGKDPFLANLLLRNVPAKIAYTRSSQNQQDLDKVEQLLKEVETELEDAHSSKEQNVREEIANRVSKDNSPLSSIDLATDLNSNKDSRQVLGGDS